MEKSFDFGKLLQNNEKKHKSKPMQFESVAGGVKKRLENGIEKRKTLRLSVFDSIRNLPKPEDPTPVKNTQSKAEHRRLQLEKWKEEKEKKKKEALLQKKKPFIVGVSHNAQKFVPPPLPKPIPSTSGCVTRSQSAKISNNVSKQKNTKETKQLKKDIKSFAPKNAMFNPVLNNLAKPTLEAPKKTEKKKNAIENTIEDKARSKPKSAPKQYEPINLRSRPDNKIIKSRRDDSPVKLSSASCVDSNTSKESQILKVKTPTKSKHNNKFSTPKNTIPKSESSSEERLRSPKAIEMLMTPQQIAEEAKKISPCVTLSRGKDNARREMKNKLKEGLLDYDLCQMESVETFRQQLDSETKRMTEICDTWEKISEQIPLPEAVQDAPPLTPINLDATPARSILKSNVKSSKKSIKVVLFNNSNQDLQETMNKDDDCKKLNAQNIDDNLKTDLSSMDTEDKENKSRRKQKLVRQEALEDRDSPIMTRSRRKSIQTPK